MDESWSRTVDELCRRRCTFAFYRLPGNGERLRFCMQANGGDAAMDGSPGFVLAPFAGTARLIRNECSAPPTPERFAPLPPASPRRPATTREEYHRRFRLYHGALGHQLHKVVLARTADVPRPPQFSPARALCEACAASPLNFNALVHTEEHGTWLCSTPELLLRGESGSWETMALAGTRPAATLPTPWDAKNRHEQALVAEYIRDTLAPLWTQGEATPTETLRTGQLEHLCTRFRFSMPAERLGELLATLPPTPAVCGSPATAARELLQAEPDINRRLYAGYMGPLGANSAAFYVTLRCMRLFADTCRLYGGGGLVPDSDEESEWRETEAKMQPMRHLLSL